MTEPQHSGHSLPWRLSPGPHNGGTSQGGPGKACGSHGCFERRNATLTFEDTGGKFALSTVVEVTGEHHSAELEGQGTDQQEHRNAEGPPLGTLVVDVNVGNHEVGARRVRSSAELAADNHARDGPCSVPELARAEHTRGWARWCPC